MGAAGIEPATSIGHPAQKGAAAEKQLDQRFKLSIRVADEAEAVAALADGVRRTFGFDALLGEARERAVEVVDADRDVPVASAVVVGAAVVVERQLEHALLVAG